jgi:phytoene desaturase
VLILLDFSDMVESSGSREAGRGQPHAVIVGSGFGGLAAAIRLGARGYRVTVLEHLDAPGGRAYVFHQDGFVFDAGPTIITAPFLLEELWRLCDRRFADDVELRSLKPFYRIRFYDGEILDCSSDDDAMALQINRLAPTDLKGYIRFLKASEEIYKVAFERLAHEPFSSFTDMLRLAPDLLRLRSYKSIYALAASFVKDPRMRFALSFHPLFVGGNPFTTTSIYGLIAFLERHWGVHCAIGGTGSIVNGMLSLIHGQGNRIRYGARVASIMVAGRRANGVRLASGEELAADIVVSNADSASMYRDLLPAALNRRWTKRKIARARYSMSLFVWYFGTARQYADVPHHTIMAGPRYRELLEDIFEHKVLADDFSLYLHRPTASDSSLAPAGCDAFYVLSPVPHLDGNIDWHSKAETYRLAISRHLSLTVLPDLEEHVVSSRIMTPLDFRDRLLSYKGAAFGLAPALSQSAWFRPHNQSEDIAGLYLVGAGTHPGAGLPGVLSSARILDRVVPDAGAFVR